MGEHLHAVDKLLTRIIAALDTERKNRASTLRNVFLRQREVRARWQRWILHPQNARMCLEELSDRERVGNVPVHAHAECLDPLYKQEGIERADTWSKIAQAFHPRANNERDVLEHIPEHHTVIGRRRLADLRKIALAVVELAPVYDDSSDTGAVAAHELGERVHDDVAAEIDWAAEVRSSEGIVDHQRYIVIVRDLRHRLDVEHIAARITDRLAV